MRLDQYLGQNNIASRREAKRLIMEGLVLVNKKIVREPGFILRDTSTVTLAKGMRDTQENKKTILMYKPRGITCSHNDEEGVTLYQKFPQFKDLTYVGRLDKDSEGLLILSNDGLITKAVTGEHSQIEKEYVVTVREKVEPEHLKKIARGIKIDREKANPAQAFRDDNNTMRIILTEGKKHQVRRMANALHLTVHSLKRIRIGNLVVAKMRPGQFRQLTEKEIDELKSA